MLFVSSCSVRASSSVPEIVRESSVTMPKVFAMAVAVAVSYTHLQVIRVGYPIQKGLTEVDASGQYSGYTYDYLEEICLLYTSRCV